MSRGFVVPSACYLLITLGVPLLRGAHARGAFASHAAVVLAAVACAGLLFALIARARRLLRPDL